MNQGLAYLNGQWRDAATVAIGLDDLGFVLGATIVERLRTFNHQSFRVDAHVRRLQRSLEIVGWTAPQLSAEVQRAIEEFPRRNAELMTPGDDWAIVAFVTPGATADAARPTVCVHGFPLPFSGWAREFDEGAAVRIVDVRHVPSNCWPPEMKCRSRIHYYLADRQAAHAEPGSRAVLLDQQGRVAEASTANIVCYFRDRGLVTPPLEGVLPGISQQELFDLATEAGIPHGEQDLLPRDLLDADELYLASTSVCLLPVVRVDGQPIGSGGPGPIYRQLLTAWSQRVGVDVSAQAREFAQR